MKTTQLKSLMLAAATCLAMHQAMAQPVDLHALSSNTYTQNFDGLLASTNPWTAGSLPGEWSVATNVTSTYIGTTVGFDPNNASAWTNTAPGFINFAGVFDYVGGTNYVGDEDWAAQTNQPNRALGIRQTGAFGDPGASFILKLKDTGYLHDFALSADFLNLDASSPRQTVWTIEYGFADLTYGVPLSFFPAAMYTNVPGTFNSYHTNIALPDGTINNVSNQVWIRVSALSASDGSGNRESFAIDNVGLTWAVGPGPFTPARVMGSPAPLTVYSNATAKFTVAVAGTPPYGFQWLKDGIPLFDGGHYSGSQATTLSVLNATTTEMGVYSCVVSNFNTANSTGYTATSGGAALIVRDPPEAPIGYLRTLVDPATFAVTNQSLFYRITGLITTYTNMTGCTCGSYYLQDGTGGLNIFVTGQNWRPGMGDMVTAVGFLSPYNGSVEFYCDLRATPGPNNACLVQTLSNNIAAYPAPKLLSWDGLGIAPTNANLNYNVAGSVVLLTNVYFYTNTGIVTPSTGSRYYWVTNSDGKFTQVAMFPGQDIDMRGRTLPPFAYAVQGVLIPYTPNPVGVVPTNGNYEIGVTRWVDVMIDPLKLSVTHSGTSSTITWTAVPLTWAYTVWAAPEVTGPFSAIATGLKFTDTSGTYTDADATADHKFYRVTTP